MAAGDNNYLPGYVGVLRNKQEVIIDHSGPNPYSNVVVNGGTGDIITADALNMGGIELADADALSSDGLNYVWVEYIGGGTGNAVPSIRLRWMVLATQAEVANGVDLSAKIVRVRLRVV